MPTERSMELAAQAWCRPQVSDRLMDVELATTFAEILDEQSGRQGIDFIAAERARQITQEGWTPEHDDEHSKDELAQAAACYAWPPMRPAFVKKAWPWDAQWWKPELFGAGANEAEKLQARIRVLAKAGALIAAEIDRIHRLLAHSSPADKGDSIR